MNTLSLDITAPRHQLSTVTSSMNIKIAAEQYSVNRYHGLDALRGIAMVLGIVLHASLPYFDTMGFWPSNGTDSRVIWALFEFIHLWRMPLFFILSGFFAALVMRRHSWRGFNKNRMRRVLMPFAIFVPLIALSMPWIWNYGYKGTFAGQVHTFEYVNPWHLWFLIHLLLFLFFMAILRMIRWLSVTLIGSTRVNNVWRNLVDLALKAFFARTPITLVTLLIFLLITDTDLIGNPLATFTYFSFGYGLYQRQSLIDFMKKYWFVYFVVGSTGYGLYLWTTRQLVDKGENEGLGLLYVALNVVCAVVFSLGLIGIAESRIIKPNQAWRWLADSSYWVYLVHLPIVTICTFAMFSFSIPPELKFITAIGTTTLVSLITYKFFVRRTIVGVLLNGRRL